jgi:hypothetical protein
MIDLWTDQHHTIHASDNGYTTLCDKPLPDMEIAPALEPTCQHCLYVLDLRQARAGIAVYIAKAKSGKQYPFDPVDSHFPNFGEAIQRHINDRIKPLPEMGEENMVWMQWDNNKAYVPHRQPIKQKLEKGNLELARKVDEAQQERHSNPRIVAIPKTFKDAGQMERELEMLLKVVKADLVAGESVSIQVSGFRYELKLEAGVPCVR